MESNKAVPTAYAYGITNRCEDGQLVFFADYDKVKTDLIFGELDFLLKKYSGQFTNFLLLSSSPNVRVGGEVLASYHVISFAKMPFQRLCDVLENTSVDRQFYKALVWRKSNTLRVSPKFNSFDDAVLKVRPCFAGWYPRDDLALGEGVEVSSAHYKMYSYFFEQVGCNDFKWLVRRDCSDVIERGKYETTGGYGRNEGVLSGMYFEALVNEGINEGDVV
jgi:hypothetical protein